MRIIIEKDLKKELNPLVLNVHFNTLTADSLYVRATLLHTCDKPVINKIYP